MFRTRHKLGKGKKFVYAIRDSKGRFADIESIGKSVADDKRFRAKRKVKPGYGFMGDLK